MKCWDVPSSANFHFSHLPIDWMLQYLQKYEPLMTQKMYLTVGLVWEWDITIEQLTTTSSSWGQHSKCFAMSLKRNDSMTQVETNTQQETEMSGAEVTDTVLMFG